MTELFAILLTALLFVALGLLTRERPDRERAGSPSRESEDACGTCNHSCETVELPDARS